MTAEQNEFGFVHVMLKNHPDVTIVLGTYINRTNPRESLLSKDANNDVKLNNPHNFKALRRGARSLNGIDGEEVLERVKEKDGVSSHGFAWESVGKLNDVLAPAITLELDTGVGPNSNTINSSLSDDAVLELWDKISGSLRLRPTGGDKHSAADLPKTPLGTLAATGAVCPHTGGWQCSESGEVEGGARQHFTAGETLPPAVLLGAPSLWQKLTNQRPRHATATVWTLVAYDAVPDVAPAGTAPAPAPGKG